MNGSRGSGLADLQNKIFWKILTAVLSLHCFLLFCPSLTNLSFETNIDRPIKRLVVQTISLHEKKEQGKRPLESLNLDQEYRVEKLIEEDKEKIIASSQESHEPFKPVLESFQEANETKETVKKIVNEKKVIKADPKEKVPIKRIEESKKNLVKSSKTEKKIKQEKKKPIMKKAELKVENIPVKKEIEEPKKSLRQKQFLTEAKERLAKIEKSYERSDSSHSVAPIASINTLEIEATADRTYVSQFTAAEVRYYDELSNRLKLFLRLPEYGDVKVKLTLHRSGQVAKIVVLDSESKRNRHYIEKTMPTLTFAAFGEEFGHEQDHVFILTLSNEI